MDKKELKNKFISIRVTEEVFNQVKKQEEIYGTTTLYIEHLLKQDEINCKSRKNTQ